MKAMILGAGRIGRGFVSELLHANQVEITYFDASPVMVDKLNEKKEYTIHVLGAEELNTHMELTPYAAAGRKRIFCLQHAVEKIWEMSEKHLPKRSKGWWRKMRCMFPILLPVKTGLIRQRI